MRDFRPNGGGRGGFDRGRPRGNRFGGRGGGFGRDRDSSERQMHDVICSKCGNECQVPFKPTGNKPVLCSDCFRQDGEGQGRNFNSRSNFQSPDNSIQFKEINVKLDKILAVLSSLEIVADEDRNMDEEQDEEEL